MFHSFRNVACLALFTGLTPFLGGCFAGGGDFTSGPAPLERTVDPVLVQAHQRMGKVYCTRGFLGIFSTGMMDLSDRINSELGVTSVSIADQEYGRLQDWLIEEHKKGTLGKEPLVLLGHSYGADDMIRVAERIKKENITVDLLVLIDPVTPPAVPNNVKRVYCVYKSRPLTDGIPAWRGVAATVADPATIIENVDLRTAQVDFPTEGISHPQIDKNAGVQDMAIAQIKTVCPQRPGWQPAPTAGGTGVAKPKP